jgi:hypothetical protein
MLDTFMVLWTRGICSRFLQTLATFLCLFIGICVLLFLVTASGVKWSGLAVTVPPPGSATPQATFTPASVPYTLPIILQNPTVLPSAKRPPARRHMPLTPVVGPTSNTQPGGQLMPDATPVGQTLFP